MPSRLFKVSVLARCEHEELFVGARRARPKFGNASHASTFIVDRNHRPRVRLPTFTCRTRRIVSAKSSLVPGWATEACSWTSPAIITIRLGSWEWESTLKKTGTAHVPSLSPASQMISRVDSILATLANRNTWYRSIGYTLLTRVLY